MTVYKSSLNIVHLIYTPFYVHKHVYHTYQSIHIFRLLSFMHVHVNIQTIYTVPTYNHVCTSHMHTHHVCLSHAYTSRLYVTHTYTSRLFVTHTYISCTTLHTLVSYPSNTYNVIKPQSHPKHTRTHTVHMNTSLLKS